MLRDRAAARGKLIFLVTEDWYFWSHRLPVARAARDVGFEIIVATRVRDHGERIRGEGFRLHELPWRRRGDGILGATRAIIAIAALYRRERPDVVHHVALKPVLFGAIACRLAFPRAGARPGVPGVPGVIAAVTGLGAGLATSTMLVGLGRRLLQQALRLAARGGRVIVQNPEDGTALTRLGVDAGRITLIRGSGVDTDHFAALPRPAGSIVTIAFVSRMLRSKGVLDAVEAVRRLRERGVAVELVLAGPADLDNRDSLDEARLQRLAAQPGIEWLGPVDDVRAVWRRAAIAVLPSTYGEGVPKALIEAAACARPIVTTDMPGCRDIVHDGETGVLVPPHDIAALTEALGALARDPARREAMGRAGRALVEREFGEAGVARQTLALYEAVMRERASRS
ncbi:MAG TPA: glycosyltransferase family 4 protein [Stellaceae bacterium]|nr:glycosyltransferase family 4 protein [Stellaceae bacterium]